MARITVFGAGAMGTAIAIHLSRNRHDTILWASPYDARVFPSLTSERKHPALPEHLPHALKVMAPEQLAAAAEGLEIAVMGAHSGGARTLARLVREAAASIPLLVGVAKGLEPATGKRMSQVYSEEFGHDRVVSIGGPCLASELAQSLPTAAVFPAARVEVAEEAAVAFRSPAYHVTVTDDLPGVEYCTVGKNVAAIAMGMLDGLGKVNSVDYKNAKAALFTRAVGELTDLIVSLGGRAETVGGLAGLGDTLVTSLGGRNRLYGELVGEGADPEATLRDLVRRGMTVEGVESTRQFQHLADSIGVDFALHRQVHRVLFENASPQTLLDLLKG